MIKKLFIKNFALIENLQIDFTNGFNVLSGETGSGKSIILEAISLLTGKRSDKESLYDKSKKCILESELCIDINNLHYPPVANKLIVGAPFMDLWTIFALSFWPLR